MSDQHASNDAEPIDSAPPAVAATTTAPYGVDVFAWLSGIAAVAAWGFAWVKSMELHRDLGDTFGASAVQISQLADEAGVEMMQYWALATGLTATAVLLALASIAWRVN